MSTIAKRGLLLLLFVSGVGCTVSDVDPPMLTGPSEMALRLALTVTPDSILGDGGSQAVLNISLCASNKSRAGSSMISVVCLPSQSSPGTMDALA
jgi:hypothetical protein